MYTVLYSEDLEPITVIQFDPGIMHLLVTKREALLAVPVPPALTTCTGRPPRPSELRHIRVRVETLLRYGEQHYLLSTPDVENALLLRSALLPGQRMRRRSELNQAFSQGFHTALKGMQS